MLNFLIFSPILASIVLLLVRNRQTLEGISVFAVMLEFTAGLFVAAEAIPHTNPIDSYFGLDSLSGLFLLLIITVSLLATLYSVGYLRTEFDKQIIGNRRIKQYYILLQLFLATMVMAVSTANPIIMWTAVEATTLATVFLISFYNKPASTEAAWKYLIINSIGLLLGFLGILLYFTSFGDKTAGVATWQSLGAAAPYLNPFIAKLAFIFVFIGFGTKIGLAPMHTWKPDAYSKAPSPIGALLSGALLNVAFLAVLRFKTMTDTAIGPDFTREILMFFGVFSLLIAAFIIFVQKSYKRLLAYSSIEHAGLASLGLGFGGTGIFYALLHLVFHSLAKSLLFFASGNIFLKYSSTKIAKVRGALSVLPWTAPLFIIGFLIINGLPPFGMFITEFNILAAGITMHPAYVIIALFCLVLIFTGFLRHVSHMAFGEASSEIKAGEANLWTVIPPIILAAAILVLSLYIPAPLKTLLTNAAGVIK